MIGTIQNQNLIIIIIMRISNHRTLCNEHSKEEIAWFSLQMNLGQGAKWARRDEADVEVKMLQVRVGWPGQPLP